MTRPIKLTETHIELCGCRYKLIKGTFTVSIFTFMAIIDEYKTDIDIYHKNYVRDEMVITPVVDRGRIVLKASNLSGASVWESSRIKIKCSDRVILYTICICVALLIIACTTIYRYFHGSI